ncbi:MAG: transposase [Cytophagaceae bacterium]|nr:MAG: transposase [Cytophagaceae bacterium]
MAETRKRRLFSKQFKDNAVRQVVDGGKRVAEVGRDIGVSGGLIGKWVQQAKAFGSQRFVGTGHQTSLEEKNRRLRRENARLVEERTTLKKAARFMLLEKS